MSDQSKNAAKGNKRLGRGLGSLLGGGGEGAFAKSESGAHSAAGALKELNQKFAVGASPGIREGFREPEAAPVVPDHLRVWQLGIERVFPNPNQPRRIFERGPLEELANSIREKGIIQPILVRRAEGGEFEIIAGERRWRAAQIAGLKEVPALVRESDDRDRSELALIENIQREDLNAVEEAEAYEYLMRKYGMTQVELAQKVGKDRATVANVLRLLNLPVEIRQMVSAGEISLGQAKVLLSVGDPKRMASIAARARAEGLSVRALERLVMRSKQGEDPSPSAPDARGRAAAALAEDLQKDLGARVRIEYDAGKGKLVLHFHSDSELNGLVEKLRAAWRA